MMTVSGSKDVKKKNIAVVGVSNREDKYGFRIFRDLIAAGFNISGVNPLGGERLGRKIYKSLKEIAPAPDLVITVVPYQITEKIVEECRDLSIKELWMQPGSESQSAVNKAKEYGIAVTHNACFMVDQELW